MRQERLWSTNSATLCTAKWSTTLTSSPQKVSTASSSCPPYFFTSACEDSYRVHLGSISWPTMLTLTSQTQSLPRNIFLYDTVRIWNTVMAKSTAWSIVNLRSTLLQWLTSAHACSMNCGWLQSANLKKSKTHTGPCSQFPWNALESWNIQITSTLACNLRGRC